MRWTEPFFNIVEAVKQQLGGDYLCRTSCKSCRELQRCIFGESTPLMHWLFDDATAFELSLLVLETLTQEFPIYSLVYRVRPWYIHCFGLSVFLSQVRRQLCYFSLGKSHPIPSHLIFQVIKLVFSVLKQCKVCCVQL